MLKAISSSTIAIMPLLIAGFCGTSYQYGQADKSQSVNPFSTIESKWLSYVNSYSYRFEIHGVDEAGNRVVLFLEASGDQRDHTVVVENDQQGNAKTILISNPNYIASIRARDEMYELVELRDNSRQSGNGSWSESRGIDPFFVATTMFFLMRANEIKGFEQINEGDNRFEWVPKDEDSLSELEEGGQRLARIVVISSNGDVSEVELATEQVISRKIYAKTTKAKFENWSYFGEVRIPLVAKYYLDGAFEPYSEFRIKSSSDITFNTSFDKSTCYLQYYGLPEPGLGTADAGLSGWWRFGVVSAGILLIILPFLFFRRMKR